MGLLEGHAISFTGYYAVYDIKSNINLMINKKNLIITMHIFAKDYGNNVCMRLSFYICETKSI